MAVKFYIVWETESEYFYTDAIATLMTQDFTQAKIFDNHEDIWRLREDNPHFGRFKVHQANEKDIFRWKLKNEVPRERL